MVRVKQTVTVQPGGRVEVTSEQLPVGSEAEVIVSVNQAAASSEGSDNGKSVAPPIWEFAQAMLCDLPKDEKAALPSDLAAEHDHYLYGLPKRTP